MSKSTISTGITPEEEIVSLKYALASSQRVVLGLVNRALKEASPISTKKYEDISTCPLCTSADIKKGKRDRVPYLDCKSCRITIYFYGVQEGR